MKMIELFKADHYSMIIQGLLKRDEVGEKHNINNR